MVTASDTALDDLIACPKCDALYRASGVEKGERATCARCHTVLIAPQWDAGLIIIAMATASVILVTAALFLPFIEISRLGFGNSTTIIGTAFAFSDGPLLPLAWAVVAFMVGLPLIRLLLILYTITPLVFDRKPLRGARDAFLWAETLKPWCMVEIFVIGCAVSLIKLADLARVEFGPAFWMFCVLLVLLLVQDTLLCRWSTWKALER
ncbi:MAG: paraquat-inducible protein A [Pseudomonadota bacterium]